MAIDTETQKAIFRLLSISEVFNCLIEYGYHRQNKYNINEFISTQACIDQLRREIVRNHKDELVKILVKIPGLSAMQEFLDIENISSYNNLCKFIIPKTIACGKLTMATGAGADVSKICPDNFFPLKSTDIKVEESMQEEIFGLLLMDEIFNILITYGYHKQSKPGIKEFISISQGCIKSFQDRVGIYHKKGLASILSKILIHEKLKKATNNLKSTCMACPDNFFLLKGTSLTVERLVEQDIFGLLHEDEIVQALVNWGYHKQNKYDIK